MAYGLTNVRSKVFEGSRVEGVKCGVPLPAGEKMDAFTRERVPFSVGCSNTD